MIDQTMWTEVDGVYNYQVADLRCRVQHGEFTIARGDADPFFDSSERGILMESTETAQALSAYIAGKIAAFEAQMKEQDRIFNLLVEARQKIARLEASDD